MFPQASSSLDARMYPPLLLVIAIGVIAIGVCKLHYCAADTFSRSLGTSLIHSGTGFYHYKGNTPVKVGGGGRLPFLVDALGRSCVKGAPTTA